MTAPTKTKGLEIRLQFWLGVDVCSDDLTLDVEDLWAPEDVPDVIDAKAVAEALMGLTVTGQVSVVVPNPAFMPGMDALPGMEKPQPYVATTDEVIW